MKWASLLIGMLIFRTGRRNRVYSEISDYSVHGESKCMYLGMQITPILWVFLKIFVSHPSLI